MAGEGGNIIRNVLGKSYKEAESITKDASKGALDFKSPKETTFHGKSGGKQFNEYQAKKENLPVRVLAVKCYEDFDCTKEAGIIEKERKYFYKVIQYNRKPTKAELKNLKWGIQYDDGKIADAPQVTGEEKISHFVSKDSIINKVRVYAFFKASNKNASLETKIRTQFYRFNPSSYKAGYYSKSLNNFYVTREKWQANPPILQNRSFEPYVLIEKTNEKYIQDIQDKEAIPTLTNSFFGIAIHHSGNSGIKTMTEVQDEHVNGKNKFADVGYHFGIDLSGVVYEGRYIGVKGSHLTKYNTGIIGIVFLADFDHDYFWDTNGDDEMSSKALVAIMTLINSLKEQFPNINVLGGHNEWKNNVGERRCPGEYGMLYVNALRQKLNMKSPKDTGHG